MATVRLVTPADKTTSSAAAFENELAFVGWDTASIYQCISASDYGGLTNAARKALTDAQGDTDSVLVAAGTMAAFTLQSMTTSIPIVLAFGGEAPSNANTNLTGFTRDAVQIGKDHIGRHKDKGHTVTLLWDQDANNQASQDVYKALTQIIPAKKLNELTLQTLSADKVTDGFMLIPNATFFEQFDLIARIVDLSSTVKEAYYPEIEYWRAHKRKDIVQIHGHNVELTFRQAAHLVDDLLNKRLTSLPKLKSAIPEDYNW